MTRTRCKPHFLKLLSCPSPRNRKHVIHTTYTSTAPSAPISFFRMVLSGQVLPRPMANQCWKTGEGLHDRPRSRGILWSMPTGCSAAPAHHSRQVGGMGSSRSGFFPDSSGVTSYDLWSCIFFLLFPDLSGFGMEFFLVQVGTRLLVLYLLL